MSVREKPVLLRRLADAIDAEDRTASELWVAARRGEHTQEQKDAYNAARARTEQLLVELRRAL